MILLTTFVAVAIATVLLVAALEKARTPELTAAMLRGLGVRRSSAMAMTRLLTLAELGTALAVLFAPGSTFTLAAIVILAVAFAVAGGLALRSDEPIRCTCFGAGAGGGGGYLGRRQIIALVPWFAGVAVLGVATPNTDGAALFALTALLILAARSMRLATAFLEARGDRKSAQEMLLWLPSH